MCLLNRGYVRTIAHTSRNVTKELNDIRQRKIRTNREEIYNYFCKTKRFRNSPLVCSISEYSFNSDRDNF